MNDLQLKELLLDTCPVRPGQEERSWERFNEHRALRARSWTARLRLPRPTWRAAAYAAFGIVLAVGMFGLGLSMRPERHALVFADSQTPAVYATSYYSNSAHAQVVWLNGMEPVSDQPTYLDPTTVIAPKRAVKAVPRPDNSL